MAERKRGKKTKDVESAAILVNNPQSVRRFVTGAGETGEEGKVTS